MVRTRDYDPESSEDEEEQPSASEASEAEADDDDDEAEEVDVPEDEEVVAQKKAADYKANVAALKSGAVNVQRAPLVPGILSTDPIAVLKRPFKSPCLNHEDDGGGESLLL